MTVYVTDTPWLKPGVGPLYHLWADDPDEMFIAAHACGAGEADLVDYGGVSWRHYLISPDRKALAHYLGAVRTDSLGPAEWCAIRRLERGEVDFSRVTLDTIARVRGASHV